MRPTVISDKNQEQYGPKTKSDFTGLYHVQALERENCML